MTMTAKIQQLAWCLMIIGILLSVQVQSEDLLGYMLGKANSEVRPGVDGLHF